MDVGKVVKSIEEAIQHFSRYSGDEYGREYDYARVGVDVLEDAIALLKAQEPVEPKLIGIYYVCGQCGMRTVGQRKAQTNDMLKVSNYCPDCGRAVKWE